MSKFTKGDRVVFLGVNEHDEIGIHPTTLIEVVTIAGDCELRDGFYNILEYPVSKMKFRQSFSGKVLKKVSDFQFLELSERKDLGKDGVKRVVFDKTELNCVNFDDIKNSDIVGFIDSFGEKGFVSVYCGDFENIFFKPISILDCDNGISPNCLYCRMTRFRSVKDALSLKGSVRYVKEAYIFPNMKALLKWLSED